ncbi:16493_t:CDS:2, partial [Entrophospora sp. SA101]
VENYEILQKVVEPMINELHNLVTNGLIDSNGIKWRIEPYFSSDLKFLTIILGFNAANANYFCPWCLCMKKDIGNKEKAYKIEKNMEQLQTPNPPPGHLKVPLLPMIPLNNYVPDELHVMLRIWNFSMVSFLARSRNTKLGLYIINGYDMKIPGTNPTQFSNQAKQWLDLFLTPSQGEPNTTIFKMGLYHPKDVTPYIHVLIHHLPEFMEQHQQLD